MIEAGSLIDYRLRLHGIPVWWRTQIEEWTPPHGFVDVQRYGPFRRWHHRHVFIEADSGTLIEDTVNYDLYARRLGRTPILGWINRDLHRIFTHRQQQIAEIFDDGRESSTPFATETGCEPASGVT